MEGTGAWSSNKHKLVLAPGIQQPSKSWTATAEDCEDEYAFVVEVGNAEALEPRSLVEAQKQPDWPLWEKAIEEVLNMLREAGMWEVVEAPKGVNVVGSK